MRTVQSLTVGLATLGLSGCVGVPAYDMAEDEQGNPVTVQQIVDRIQCEVFRARTDKRNERFAALNYVGAATLTLEVNDKAAFTPSLSFIDPLSAAATNFTVGVGGELSKARKRTFQQSYSLAVPQITNHACNKVESAGNLAGELGIEELVELGMTASDDKDLGVSYVDAKLEPLAGPVFGSTISFTIVKSGSVGPQWTLRTFKGPSASAGLGGLARSDVHTLLISFAPPKKAALEANSRDLSSALEAAKANNVDMRLYSIAPR